MWDVFISHASEDKEAVARPLASLLEKAGLRVWLDAHTLRLGDNLRQKIDEGLAQSRFGVVILSKSFLAKRWPKQELDGLYAREEDGRKVILPVWHQLTRQELAQASPLLAGRLAAETSEGLEFVAQQILDVVQPDGPKRKEYSLDDLVSRDAALALPASEHLPIDDASVRDALARLQWPNPVVILAVRTYLARDPARAAPAMVELIRQAHRDWDAANFVPNCFSRPFLPFCGTEIGELALKSNEIDVARKAAESIGYMGSDDWVWPLFERLEKDRGYFFEKVNFYVVTALARVFVSHPDDGKFHAFYQDRLRYLLKRLEQAIRVAVERDPNHNLKSHLEDILALSPQDRADLLVQKWGQADLPLLRGLAARALGNMRLQRMTPFLAQRLADAADDADVRREAAFALGNTGGPAAVDALLRCLHDPGLERAAQNALCRALDAVADANELDRHAASVLALPITEPWLVYRAMGLRGDVRFVAKLLGALDDAHHTVRAAASLALARQTGAAHRPRLEQCFAEAGTPMEKTLGGLALIVAAGNRVEPALLGEIRQTLAVDSYMYHRRLRADIVDVLSRCPDDEPRQVAACWARVYQTMPGY